MDTVSPNALKRAVVRALPTGAAFCLREVGTPSLFGFFADLPRTLKSGFADVGALRFSGTSFAGPQFLRHEKLTLADADGNVFATGFHLKMTMTLVLLAGLAFEYVVTMQPRPTRLRYVPSGTSLTLTGALGSSLAVLAQPPNTSLAGRRFHVALDYQRFRATVLVGIPRVRRDHGIACDSGPPAACDASVPGCGACDGANDAILAEARQVAGAVQGARAAGITADYYIEDYGCSG